MDTVAAGPADRIRGGIMIASVFASLILVLFAQSTPKPFPNEDYVCHIEEDHSFECGHNNGSGNVDFSQPFVTGCLPSDDNACQSEPAETP
jgi:hypothetical protein